MEKKIYTVAVDLGSSNVVVIVGSKNDDGSLRIEKVVSKPADGVNAGEIENIASVGNSIRTAMQ
ncbi:MAG: cell division protein FtsA, partial [Alistipes sp.]|nr:cell division protein FtsA [Alistipes sp.]